MKCISIWHDEKKNEVEIFGDTLRVLPFDDGVNFAAKFADNTPRSVVLSVQSHVVAAIASRCYKFRDAILRRGGAVCVRVGKSSQIRDVSSLADSATSAQGIFDIMCAVWSRTSRRTYTAGALAVALARDDDAGFFGRLDRNSVQIDVAADLCSKIGSGKIYKNAHGLTSGAYAYDISSAYPHALSSQKKIPCGAIACDADDKNACAFFVRVKIDADDKNKISPVADCYNGDKTGQVRALITRQELDDIRDANLDFDILQAYRGTASTSIPPLRAFFSDLYDARKSDMHAKKIANLACGKFRTNPFFFSLMPRGAEIPKHAQGISRENAYLQEILCAAISKEYSDDDENADEMEFHSASQPLTALQIVGAVRSRIYRDAIKLQRAGWRVFYIDTDSIHTNAPPDAFASIVADDLRGGFGKYKIDCAGDFYHIAPKIWACIGDDGTVRTAFAGIDLQKYAGATVEIIGDDVKNWHFVEDETPQALSVEAVRTIYDALARGVVKFKRRAYPDFFSIMSGSAVVAHDEFLIYGADKKNKKTAPQCAAPIRFARDTIDENQDFF